MEENQKRREKNQTKSAVMADQLPEDCICSILAFMSPKDVCSSAAVSAAFRSAADSDALWSSFLPANYKEIFSQALTSSSPLLLNSLSKKDLYFYLCDHPILIGAGNSSFALEKESKKLRYMMGVKDLQISTQTIQFVQNRNWDSLPKSRFSQVALVLCSQWLDTIEINGKIDGRKLTPNTNYSVYFVFILVGCTHDNQELRDKSILLTLHVEGIELDETKISLFDHFIDQTSKVPYKRRDGWMEIEMGQIFTESGEYHPILMSLIDVYDDCFQCGILIDGIEIRPSCCG